MRRSPASPTWRAAETRALILDSSSTRRTRPLTTTGRSTIGSVFGIITTPVKPPAAAAAEPLSIVSSSSRPGVRQWAWTSTKPGKRCRPPASTSRGPRRPSPISEILPDEMRTSMTPSRPVDGSRTWAPRTTSSGVAAESRITRRPSGPRPSRGRGRRSGRRRRRRPGRGSGRNRPGRRRRRSRLPC